MDQSKSFQVSIFFLFKKNSRSFEENEIGLKLLNDLLAGGNKPGMPSLRGSEERDILIMIVDSNNEFLSVFPKA